MYLHISNKLSDSRGEIMIMCIRKEKKAELKIKKSASLNNGKTKIK